MLGAPGSVFVANYVNSLLNDGAIGNSLINSDVAGGDFAWRKAGDYASTPAYADGVVYAANELPLRLEARTEADGALLWSWTPPTGDEDVESEVLLTDNLAFVSTNLATYAIDLVPIARSGAIHRRAAWRCRERNPVPAAYRGADGDQREVAFGNRASCQGATNVQHAADALALRHLPVPHHVIRRR